MHTRWDILQTPVHYLLALSYSLTDIEWVELTELKVQTGALMSGCSFLVYTTST